MHISLSPLCLFAELVILLVPLRHPLPISPPFSFPFSAAGKLKRQVAAALGQIAKHTVDLAEVVVEAESE